MAPQPSTMAPQPSTLVSQPSLGGPLPSPPAPGSAATPYHQPIPLSLTFFRSAAELDIRSSVASACAAGPPGILMSISPHCNVWDDSLIADWEQQGFTFPHLHPPPPPQAAPPAMAAAAAEQGPGGEAGKQAGEEAVSAEAEDRGGASAGASDGAPASGPAPEGVKTELSFRLASAEGAAAAEQPAPGEEAADSAAGGGAPGAGDEAVALLAEGVADAPEAGPPVSPAALPSAITYSSPFAQQAGEGWGGGKEAEASQGGGSGAGSATAAVEPVAPVGAGAAPQGRGAADGGAVGEPLAADGAEQQPAAAAADDPGKQPQQAPQRSEHEQLLLEQQQQRQAQLERTLGQAGRAAQGKRIAYHQRIFVTCMFRSRSRFGAVSEKASFLSFAPHYFHHMGVRLLDRDPPTCLAKLLGVYSVTFKSQPAAGAGGGGGGPEGGAPGGAGGGAASAALIRELKEREFSMDLLVMENCFYDRPVARIYDLKGSERNRFNADAASRPEDSL
ncbi:hypothetical protein TSOC_014275, partial [Tetrabaena socialis]